MLPPPLEVCSLSSREAKLGAADAAEAEGESQPSLAEGSSILLICVSSLAGAGALAVGSKSSFRAVGDGISLARAGAAAAPLLACEMPLCGAPAGRGAAASNSDFPATSAARRRAVAMGSASGLRGCQGYCFDGSDSAATPEEFSAPDSGESGMYSSSAASTTSGCGAGSASSSKAAALAAGGAAATCGGKAAGKNVCETALDAAAGEVTGAVLAACTLRNKPRATRSVPLDCST